MTGEELERYKRQIGLLGREGQEKLKAATVFIAGAGGLGSASAIYLAAAGIGRIVLVDGDTVALSNLNRQILHRDRDVGRQKTDSARETLREINPCVEVAAVAEQIGLDNAAALVGDADLIVDALDNFPTRYLLNRTALEKSIPFLHGAVHGFFGQATTVLPGKSACLRCIFSAAPAPAAAPVLGVTPGIIGMIQASEAIKCITGVGELLAGKLLLWDGLTCRMETLHVEKNPCCPECGCG